MLVNNSTVIFIITTIIVVILHVFGFLEDKSSIRILRGGKLKYCCIENRDSIHTSGTSKYIAYIGLLYLYREGEYTLWVA